MRRLGAILAFVWFLTKDIVVGSLKIALTTVHPGRDRHLAIIELPLKARTDLEVTVLAASVTITPGTLIVGTAAGTPSEPPTLFVHSIFGERDEVLDHLHEMERLMLAAMRGEAG